MPPDDRELDAEIRGHLALSVKERVDRGEDPEAARLAALRELGSIPDVRDAMHRVWHARSRDLATGFAQDIRIGLRSLARARGLSATVVLTLALGIGANAAIVSVVRGVLLRPLVNRGEDRLVYIRQSAPGLGAANTTFSVPELRDLRSRLSLFSAFGEFSTADFTLLGFGEPRQVRAGVVSGSYFDAMGLRPALGRLLDARDDGPDAAGAAVLTYRFWTTSLRRDPTVVGRTIALGPRPATVVGVLEPSVPYPADTEIIANVVTSPHHLGAAMVTERSHRMTELFGRLAPGASLDAARAEVTAVHAGMMREHPEAYAPGADVQVSVTPFREQVTAPARPILLVLLAAAAAVFLVACANVANLMLARSVRREGELAVRAALGASSGALRRTLLAESLTLCGAGALLGILLARPLVAVVAGLAARFSPRALDVTVDGSLLWAGAGLAAVAAVLLAWLPRLPSPQRPAGFGLASGTPRVTPATTRRLRAFAAAQIATSFLLASGAGALLAALAVQQTAPAGYDVDRVLAIDLPPPATGLGGAPVIDVLEKVARRVRALPGVDGAAIGSFVPWRDAGSLLPEFRFALEGSPRAEGTAPPHGRLRIVGPGFFRVLGVPLIAGRDFSGDDRAGGERVVIVSQRIAALFPGGTALGRTMWWTDPLLGEPAPRRIVGVVADVDDERVPGGPAYTVYHPVAQMGFSGRLFVRAAGDPYALVPAVTGIVHAIAPTQAVERAATLADVRAAVLAPARLNALVLSGFAGVALLIAVVGVAGVLAFGVSARTRELGVRLALGSTPGRLRRQVLREGAAIAAAGMAVGAAAGAAIALPAASAFGLSPLPGALAIAGAAAVVLAAAAAAALMPAIRASRVNLLQALRSE